VGFDGMSVEAVARRAGVGKATIYRRWSSKEELVIDAIAQLFSEPPAPNTGDARNDLVALARNLHLLMSSRLTGGVFPRMAPEVATGSRLGRLYAERIIGPRKAILMDVLRSAIERRELLERTDVELAIDLLVGALLVRRLTGRLKRSDAALPLRVVDMMLQGLRARRA